MLQFPFLGHKLAVIKPFSCKHKAKLINIRSVFFILFVFSLCFSHCVSQAVVHYLHYSQTSVKHNLHKWPMSLLALCLCVYMCVTMWLCSGALNAMLAQRNNKMLGRFSLLDSHFFVVSFCFVFLLFFSGEGYKHICHSIFVPSLISMSIVSALSLQEFAYICESLC